MQGSALIAQLHQHHPFIFAAAGALEQAFGFQAFEQRCQRTRIGQQALADLSDGQTVLFPQHQHRQVLWISQPEFVQQRFVDLGHQQRSRVQGKAHLVVQEQFVARNRRFRVGVHAHPSMGWVL
ncbi:hypothetical protein D3C79_916640 [compost metagenome]